MSLSLIDLLNLAFISLRGKPFRSSLTALGIFMGVVAVSTPLQVKAISQAILTQEIGNREAPHAIIYPQPNRLTQETAPLKLADLDFLRSRLRGLHSISTIVRGQSEKIYFQDLEVQSESQGVSREFLATSGRSMIKGRFFNNSDFDNYRSVVVINEFVEQELFPNLESIDQRIFWQNRSYFVIGVVQQRQEFFRQKPQGLILIPITTQSLITGKLELSNISLRPTNSKDLESLGKQAEQLLKEHYPGMDFFVSSNIMDIQFMERMLGIVSVILVVLGSIALAVGGVGITNIMIASVLERTQEIGLRRALGATRADILWQFLLEAALISLFGGMVAITTIHGITVVVSNVFSLPYKFAPLTASVAVGSALVVGMGAGIVPAYRASRLDPVKALRSS